MAVLLSTDTIEKGSYSVLIEYFDNDDIIVTVLDYETKEVLGYIDIVEADEGFNINLN